MSQEWQWEIQWRHQSNENIGIRDLHRSIVTERSPHAWSPARTKGVFSSAFEQYGDSPPWLSSRDILVFAVKLDGFGKPFISTKELLTAFNMAGDSTWHVTVMGLLKPYFFDLVKKIHDLNVLKIIFSTWTTLK